MWYGIDTDFLVAVEIRDHPFHHAATERLRGILDEEGRFALAPQTLPEFVHVVTDPRRMPQPLEVEEALGRVEAWWHAAEVVHVFPCRRSTGNFLEWMKAFYLGRKRLLDTMLAATYYQANVFRLITNNDDDFRVFDCFELINFR